LQLPLLASSFPEKTDGGQPIEFGFQMFTPLYRWQPPPLMLNDYQPYRRKHRLYTAYHPGVQRLMAIRRIKIGNIHGFPVFTNDESASLFSISAVQPRLILANTQSRQILLDNLAGPLAIISKKAISRSPAQGLDAHSAAAGKEIQPDCSGNHAQAAENCFPHFAGGWPCMIAPKSAQLPALESTGYYPHIYHRHHDITTKQKAPPNQKKIDFDE
jgi:hypothetical protein